MFAWIVGLKPSLWTLHFTNSIIVFLFYLHIFNYNMDTRFVGHAVCTYFIPFISYLFYFIFKTDSMPKDSLFSSSILAWKQYRSNAQTVKIFTWNLNDDLWCLVQFVSKNENCQVSSDLILFQNENKLRILLFLLQKLNQKPKSIQLNTLNLVNSHT